MRTFALVSWGMTRQPRKRGMRSVRGEPVSSIDGS